MKKEDEEMDGSNLGEPSKTGDEKTCVRRENMYV